MLKQILFAGIAGALALTGAARAQSASATAPQAAPGPAETAAPPTAAGPATAATTPAAADAFKAGQEVKDPSGETIGTVVSAGKASNGQQAVVVNVDGKPVSLPANLFTPSGDTVASSVTKAQIQAAIPKG